MRELTVCYQRDGYALDYLPADANGYSDDSFYERYRADPYDALFEYGFTPESSQRPPSLGFMRGFASKFIASIARSPDIELTREPPAIQDDEVAEVLGNLPFALGIENVDADWVKAVWAKLSSAFAVRIGAFDGTVADFLAAHDPNVQVMGRVCFHLVENRFDERPFAFMATYSTKAGGRAEHLPLRNAMLEFKGRDDALLKLLAAVSRAADRSGLISELVESGELFSPLKFTADEAYTYLKEIPVYEECGILCRMPDWWKRKSNAIKLAISVGDKPPSHVGLDALVGFDARLYLGEDAITKEELEELLAQTDGLSFLKGKWVEVDHDKLRAALEAYEKAQRLGDMTLAEAMRMQLNPEKALDGTDLASVDITSGEWLRSLKSRALAPDAATASSPGDGFKAALRPYQQIGLGWLSAMQSLGFGSLLADDMGLGKTVQILALLESRRAAAADSAASSAVATGSAAAPGTAPGTSAESSHGAEGRHGRARTLLVIPASLIGNWVKETQRFAPHLKYKVIHGSDVEFSGSDADLFITTYGMAARLESLREQAWDLVVLDEAQAIKNPAAKQTKAVKLLKAPARIAMTGTPVENRLSDLWSLFDFLNKGLLGSSKEFSAFAKALKQKESYERLRGVVSPFILRRLKTDKSIIADLPDKLEIKEYASLTKKQAVLYDALAKAISKMLETAEGISRKGLVLASIMKFKQICNHPSQYLGSGGYDKASSGKFEKLAELCETIREKRERVLVFTQFREMTEPLAGFLETVFGRGGLILHGGTPVKARAELVERFNGAEYIPFMVLSLKAGGVGLNLTAANHVIHFDRWWNPAVENQATDRVFRIGQTKDVFVHKLVSIGTVEEKIDNMIEDKQKLAGEIIAESGERWITEMGNDELMRLFKLEA